MRVVFLIGGNCCASVRHPAHVTISPFCFASIPDTMSTVERVKHSQGRSLWALQPIKMRVKVRQSRPVPTYSLSTLRANLLLAGVKTNHQTSLLHTESNLNRLGLLSLKVLSVRHSLLTLVGRKQTVVRYQLSSQKPAGLRI